MRNYFNFLPLVHHHWFILAHERSDHYGTSSSSTASWDEDEESIDDEQREMELDQARFWMLSDIWSMYSDAEKELLHQKLIQRMEDKGLLNLNNDSFGSETTESEDSDTSDELNLGPDKHLRRMQLEQSVFNGTMAPVTLPIKSNYGLTDLLRRQKTDVDQNDIVAISTVNAQRGKEQIILIEQNGGARIYELNRLKDGFSVSVTGEVEDPVAMIGGYSCGGNMDYFCGATGTLAIPNGLIIIDSHRTIKYDFDWTTAEIVGDKKLNFGLLDIPKDGDEGLAFPTSVAGYWPYDKENDKLTENVIATSVMKRAMDSYLFVSDSGNHRVVCLNAKDLKLEASYGTGEPSRFDDSFNTPMGVAVFQPAWEFNIQPIYANVFVADYANHRVVKLDFGFPIKPDNNTLHDLEFAENSNTTDTSRIPFEKDFNSTLNWQYWEYQPQYRPTNKIRLEYSATFGTGRPGDPSYGKLTNPVTVVTYRHFILVIEERHSELLSQRIVVLTMSAEGLNFSKFRYVTQLLPSMTGILSGPMTVSPSGHIWFSYSKSFMGKHVGVIKIPKVIREAKKPDTHLDFMDQCVVKEFWNNLANYHEELEDGGREAWEKHMTLIALQADLHYWPYFEREVKHAIGDNHMEEPELVRDIDAFNGTVHNLTSAFDFELFNAVIFKGEMEYCENYGNNTVTTSGFLDKDDYEDRIRERASTPSLLSYFLFFILVW